MGKKLLTKVISQMVNEHIESKEYGVSLLNIPDFDYCDFIESILGEKEIALFFLGFDSASEETLKNELPRGQGVTYSFSVEDAEESRNSGNEDVFRVIIIKKSEIEKISSLKWFPEINLGKLYSKCCDYTFKKLIETNSNIVINNFIQVLKNKRISNILSFGRVLEYLDMLLETEPAERPIALVNNYYRLGLLSDRNAFSDGATRSEVIKRVTHNYSVLERISNLEQKERQNITNYYVRNDTDKTISGLILRYYNEKNNELLKEMELEDVETCLKTASAAAATVPNPTPDDPTDPGPTVTRPIRTPIVSPTVIGISKALNGSSDGITDILREISEEVDNRDDMGKGETVQIDVDDSKVQFKAEPMTEKLAQILATQNCMGGIIVAKVKSPEEAILNLEKYKVHKLTIEEIERVKTDLNRMSIILTENGQANEQISEAIDSFLRARNAIATYAVRLQDVPMLQVLDKFAEFDTYIKAYEKLLAAINSDFPRIWDIAASNSKAIVNVIMSLDYVYVVDETYRHAIPTPLHPLYLWKYIELAREIFSGRGVSSLEDAHLNEDDKNFIIRKAEDIPDPLSIMLMPDINDDFRSQFLPLAGRIGMVPIYSNEPQVNQSESGIYSLKQAITRYLCLYPHAAMMLRISFVDPPSVKTVVTMLKELNSGKEFNVNGIEVTIYRTKEVPISWVEIDDASYDDGLLGKYKGKRSLQFKLKIINKKYEYDKVLLDINAQQHITVVFDPNEIKVDRVSNERNIHIHPLCIPKIYKYNPLDQEVLIRPANEGGIFTVYSNIIEKLKEQPHSYSHTSTFFSTPLKRETFDKFLGKSDWLIMLDHNLKSWDISLSAASEKLYYSENEYRSCGVYSNNCKKFLLGYDNLVKGLGNLVPVTEGLKNVVETVRTINNDGLLSIVSHTSNSIFDVNHGKGSLGTAIAAIHFRKAFPGAVIVGLDTQLAKEWLSDREDGHLPDLVCINLLDGKKALVNIIEVKTYSNNLNSFRISGNTIEGHAVKQVSVLEKLMYEMFGASERITTVSRREILREQVFECLFNDNVNPGVKRDLCIKLNELFAGECQVDVTKNIAFVDFDNADSSVNIYWGAGEYEGKAYTLTTIGTTEIQAILSCSDVVSNNASVVLDNSHEEVIELDEVVVSETVNQVAEEPSIFEENLSNGDDNEESAENIVDDLVNEFTVESEEKIREKCSCLNKVLRDYSINAETIDVERVQEAARFIRFPVKLKSGATIGSLKRYKDDIAIQLEASGEILIEHMRGTSFISIDIPFSDLSKTLYVTDYLSKLNDVSGNLNVLAGQSPDGEIEIIDIAKAPHMLVAGTTGSGKTIFLQSVLVSLLQQYGSDELELLIIDPKQTDFIYFEGLKNLYGGKVVIDAEEALKMLEKINNEDKEQRTAALRSCRSRDIESYNAQNPNNKMKRLVVVIDEYSDLIQATEMNGKRKQFESSLLQLLQRVRNLGIHLIIATQRPSAQIITGALKAVIPFRISFRLPSHTDSQTILDQSGAEDLLGSGDMLIVSESYTKRLQGLFITEEQLDTFLRSKIEG